MAKSKPASKAAIPDNSHNSEPAITQRSSENIIRIFRRPLSRQNPNQIGKPALGKTSAEL
ncbi:hypothetical protein HMPREF3156_02384 [Neisseria sp. HMSC06F02]|nr:hypothetical protein HMPREF3156_02384 [Neisseria sp. HMSC06F02]